MKRKHPEDILSAAISQTIGDLRCQTTPQLDEEVSKSETAKTHNFWAEKNIQIPWPNFDQWDDFMSGKISQEELRFETWKVFRFQTREDIRSSTNIRGPKKAY